ncbi:MAG: mechanosensitive ion channel [Nitrososphaerota archaeon]|nr:mechanosensitive ion channel [Nitrososphaerota archaeon]MDG7023761.1 mechanosensitive ion channel [Nitrososphaerota archaeon]
MVDSAFGLLLESVAITVAAFLAGEALTRVIRAAGKRNGVSSATLRAVREGITAIWVTIAVVSIAHVTGIMEEFTTLTISGILGIGVTLALQTTLSNVVSGLFLLNDNVLRLNDTIQFSGVKGQVVKVALRNTWVKADDGNITVIGNGLLAGGPLTNYTALGRLSRKLELGHAR